MNLTQTHYYEALSNRSLKRSIGIVLVICVHIAMLYSLMSNKEMKDKVVEVPKKMLKAVVIQEVTLPAPTIPPKAPSKVDTHSSKRLEKPKVTKQIEMAPKVVVQPSNAVEQPQLAAPNFVSDNIVNDSVDKPRQVESPITPAPVSPVVSTPKPISIGVACPTQVAPEMPRRAISHGIEGIVQAQIHIINGAVKEVVILSGPEVFHKPVISAVMQFKCNANIKDIVATKDFSFQLE